MKNDAKDDFIKYNKNQDDKELNFFIFQKMNASNSYKEYFTDEIKKFHADKKIPVPVENYVNSKLDSFKNEYENLNESEKQSLKSKFDFKYNNDYEESFKNNFQNLNNSKQEKEISFDYEQVKSALDKFIRTENYNDTKAIENTKFMVDCMAKNTPKFQAFSERFLTEGMERNDLPSNLAKYNLSDVKRLSSNLNKNIVSKLSANIKIVKDLNTRSNLSKSLRTFRQKQFKEEYSEVKKMNQMRIKNDVSIKNKQTEQIKLT